MNSVLSNKYTKQISGPVLSLIIPAFNERGRLPSFLASSRDYLDGALLEAYEVIVVDDGSSDGTLAWLEAHTATWSELALVRHLANLGKGAAVRSGMSVARGTHWLFADADGATPISEEAKLRRAIDRGADLAIGSRMSALQCRRRSGRRIVGSTFATCSRLALGLRIRDTQCGFKMFRSDVGEALFNSLGESGFAFDLELLLRAKMCGYAIAEVPVAWREMPGSKVRLARDSWRMFRSLFAIRRRLRGEGASEPPLVEPVAGAVREPALK